MGLPVSKVDFEKKALRARTPKALRAGDEFDCVS
jgi:hypothetical protein